MANDTVWVPVLPSFRDFGRQLVQETTAAARQAGEAAGEALSDGMADRAALADEAARAVTQARQREAAAAAQTAIAEAKLEEARQKAQAKADALAQAEQELQALRDAGTATAAQITRSETQVERLRTAAQAASTRLASSEEALESARRRSTAATEAQARAQQQVEALQRGEAGTAREVLQATERVAQARTREADSAARLRVVEERLAAARADSNTSASGLLRAEEQVRSARERAEGATEARERAEQRLVQTEINAANAARDAAQATEQAGDAARGAGGDAEAGGSGFADMAKQLGAAAVAFAGVTTAADAFAEALNREALSDRLAAQLNLSAEESEKAGRIAADLYAGAWGESMEQVNDAVGAVASSLGNLTDTSEAEIKSLTATALDLSTAFGIDVVESTQLVNQLIRNGFAKDATEGFDLVTAAFQRMPAAMREELPDLINEYGTYFSTFGLSGQEAMGMLVAASQQGAIEMDKVGDALKEFGIIATDIGNTAAQDTLTKLGLDAKQMAADLLAGGDTAKSAFTQITQGLAGMSDPAEQAAAAVALFGTPIEDLNKAQIPEFLQSLSAGANEMVGFEGSAQQMGDTLNNNTSAALTGFKRGVENFLSGAAGGFIIWVQENLGLLKDLGIVAGSAAVALGGIALVQGVMAAGGFIAWLKNLTIAQWAFNSALLANPLTWIALGIAAVVAAVIIMWNKWEGFRNVVLGVWDTIREGWSALWDSYLQPAWEAVKAGLADLGGWFSRLWSEWIQPALSQVGELVAWLWDNVISKYFELWRAVIFDVVGPAVLWLWDTVVKPAFHGIADVVSWAWSNVLQPTWNFMQGAIEVLGGIIAATWRDVIEPAWRGIADIVLWAWDTIIRPAWNAMQGALDVLGGVFSTVWDNVIKPAWNALGDGIAWVWDNVIKKALDALGSAVSGLGDFFQAAADRIKPIWEGIKDAVAAPVRFVVDTVYNKGIVRAWNAVAGWIGQSEKNLTEVPVAFKDGGVLPGYSPRQDVHKFWSPTGGRLDLSGGEAFMIPEWTRAVGSTGVSEMNYLARTRGPEAVRAYMATLGDGGGGLHQKFADGGVVNGFRLTPEQARMWGAFSPHNPGAVITDAGIRTWDDGTGGRSYHYRGEALDIAGPDMMRYARWILAADPDMRELFFDPLGGWVNGQQIGAIGGHSDHVHWTAGGAIGDVPAGAAAMFTGGAGAAYAPTFSMRDLVAAAFDTIMDPIGKTIPTFPGTVGALPQGAFDTMRGQVRDWILGEADKQSPTKAAANLAATPGSGPAQEQVRQVFAGYGWGEGQQWEDAQWIISKESSWNPTAENPSSGAFGLFQFNPSSGTLQQYLPDRNPNSAVQAAAGARYIGDRYGTPSDARRFWEANGWYDQGGLAHGKGLMLKNVIQPERVLSPRETEAFESWMAAGSDGAALADAAASLEGAATALAYATGGVADFGASRRNPAQPQALRDWMGRAWGAVNNSPLDRAAKGVASMLLRHDFIGGVWAHEDYPEVERLLAANRDAVNGGDLFRRAHSAIGAARGNRAGIAGAVAAVEALLRAVAPPPFDAGGLAHGTGVLLKDIIRPERVLSPAQTEAFESWLDAGADGVNLDRLADRLEPLAALVDRAPHLPAPTRPRLPGPPASGGAARMQVEQVVVADFEGFQRFRRGAEESWRREDAVAFGAGF